MAAAKSPQHYDFIIIGGGLSGLLIANALELTGKRLVLIDENESFGGHLRPFELNGIGLESCFGLIRSSADEEKSLKWLEGQLEIPVLGPTIENAPLSFDSGQLKTFMGFGDRKFSSLEILDLYNQSTFIQLLSSPRQWIKALTETFIGEQLPLAVVTHIEATGESIEVTLNGARTISSPRVIYTAAVRPLLKLLPEDQISNRSRQKIAKSKLWTSVNLHLLHSNLISESKALHFLYGSKDEFDPTLGLFFPQEKGTPQQSSLWMGLLSSDLAEDSEAIANLLREMKKQIKRIYPNLLEEIIAEKLVISEFSHGIVDLGLKEAGILPEQKALFLADPAQTGRLPLSGAIEAARLAVNWALNSLSESISEPTLGKTSN